MGCTRNVALRVMDKVAIGSLTGDPLVDIIEVVIHVHQPILRWSSKKNNKKNIAIV